MATGPKFNYYKPERYLLSQNYKNSVQALIGAQETLSGIYSQVDASKSSFTDDKTGVESLQGMIQKIGISLKEANNDQLKTKVLSGLTKELNAFVNTPVFGIILKTYGADEYQITQVTKRLNDFVKQSYDSLQAGSEEKFDVKSIINAPLTQELFKGASALSPAIGMSVFGAFSPLVGIAGGTAMRIADKMGMNKYLKELNPFKKNIEGQGKAGMAGGAATSAGATGGFAGSPGGGGAATSAGGMAPGALTGELFTFYNTLAFKAAWTKQVLKLLQGKAGPSDDKDEEEKGGFFAKLKAKFTGMFDLIKGKIMGVFSGLTTFFSGIFSKIGGMFGNLASKAGGLAGDIGSKAGGLLANVGSKVGGFLGADVGSAAAGGILGTGAAIAGAGLAGWGAGRLIGEHTGWGGKSTDQHAQNMFSGGAISKYEAQEKAGRITDPKTLQKIAYQAQGYSPQEAYQMAFNPNGAQAVSQKPKSSSSPTYQKKMDSSTTTGTDTLSQIQAAHTKATLESINNLGNRIEKLQEKKNTSSPSRSSSSLRRNIEDPFMDLLNSGSIAINT